MKKWFAKIFASRPPHGQIDFTNVKSVLIDLIGPGLGDAIVLTATIKQLRDTYPNAKIGVIKHPRNEFIFKNNPLDVELVEKSVFYALTHRNQWQLFLDYSPSFTTKGLLFSFLLNFAYVICFEKDAKKYYNANSVKNYNEYITGTDKIHLTQFLLLTGLKNYLKENTVSYVLPRLRKEDQDTILPFLIKDKCNIMVCPFGTTKKLDNHELKDILKLALEGNENKFHLLFPNNEQSSGYLLEDARIIQTILPRQTVAQWFSLISKADLVIAVDSAAVHVASAYKKPLAAFYGGEKALVQFALLPYEHAIAITPMAPMPPNFNGTMKGFNCQDTAERIKKLILQTQSF